MATIQNIYPTKKKFVLFIATIKIFDIKQHQEGSRNNLKVTVNLFESQQQQHKKGSRLIFFLLLLNFFS